MAWLVLYLFIFLFGLIIGSFLNCVIYRLEKEEKLTGRSYCPHCKKTLNWKYLIPIFSFLFLWGRCGFCKKKISIQYPLVEILTALIFLLIFNLLGPQDIPKVAFEIYNQFEIFQYINILFLLYISSVLIIIFIYDLKHYLIPDKVLFPAIVIIVLYRLFENLNILILNSNFKFQISNFAHITNYIIAVLIASGFFLCIFLISRGAWMGFGDVKLAILLGLILGLPNILVGLFLAFFFGAIIGIILMLFNKKGLKSEIPFAPFLILGTFTALFWGQEIINWYTHFLIY